MAFEDGASADEDEPRGDADAGGSDPERVEPNTAEVNPVRRDVIDNVGRRYLVDDVFTVTPYFRFLLTF